MYVGSFTFSYKIISIYCISWGQSAGSISVAMHMLANEGNTEGLFHAAFMESGTTVPVGHITDGQSTYDTIVKSLGCLNASDTLQCLREAPFEEMKKAMSETSSFLTTKVKWPRESDA